MGISAYIQMLRDRVGHEMLLMPAVAALIRDEAGRILMQQRTDDGQWNLPSGAIDPGESPATAVVREVHEETGLLVQPVRIVAVLGGREFRHRYPNGDITEPLLTVFLCEQTGGNCQMQPGETAGLAFLTPDEAAAHLPHFPQALFIDPDLQVAIFAPPDSS